MARNPVFTVQKPWEQAGIHWGSVIRSQVDGKFKFFYGTYFPGAQEGAGEVEGLFRRQSKSCLRRHQPRRANQGAIGPGRNLQRPLVEGVSFQTVAQLFRPGPTVVDHHLVAQTVDRLQFVRRTRDTKRQRRES